MLYELILYATPGTELSMYYIPRELTNKALPELPPT